MKLSTISQPMTKRLHYIDWLRVLAFMTLIVFHCMVPFVEDYYWEINNDQTSKSLTRIVRWLHQWRLPLLFFIAGVGVRFSLKKRSITKFFGERVVRLLIPLLFAMFFIIPLQVYFERLQDGEMVISYLEFYPSVFELIPYPEGSLTWSHMWFVAYLFVFTIILIPVFALSKLNLNSAAWRKMSSLFSYPIVVLGCSLPFVIYIIYLYLDWPEQGSLIDDWYVFTTSITYYLMGFILSGINDFWQTCLTYRRYFLVSAVLLMTALMVYYYWNWTTYEPTIEGFHHIRYAVLNGLHIWLIICASIGYAMKYLNRKSSTLMYLNTAVYPFFILHQTVIVVSGFYILQWPLGIFLKLVILVITCFVSILAIYHLIIRRTAITRLLFGMKWKKQNY